MPGIDDVIRIRIDTTGAVLDFVRQLAAQAAEGETRAPANPAATAIFRELAPYRLVEYDYVDGGLGVAGVYIGFPNGAVYSAADEVPEAEVNGLLIHCAEGATELPPIYVYVVLTEPVPAPRLDGYLDALSGHIGHPLVGVYRCQGRLCANSYDGDPTWTGNGTTQARLDTAAAKALGETGRHLDKATLIARYAARSRHEDGRAYAAVTLAYVKYVLEFTSEGERDDFIAWTRWLSEWINARPLEWSHVGFPEVLRPAEPTPVPEDPDRATLLESPRVFHTGEPWTAFGGSSSGTSVDFAHSVAEHDAGEMAHALAVASTYWSYVKESVAATRSHLAARAEGQDRLAS